LKILKHKEKIPFAPTKLTIIDVEVDDDWTTTVTSIPITRPATGFLVESCMIADASFPLKSI